MTTTSRFVTIQFGLLVFAAPTLADTLYYSADVPTDPGTGVLQSTGMVWVHGPGGYGASGELSVGGVNLDALHRLDRPGSWLLSTDEPAALADPPFALSEPCDVVRFDAEYDFTPFFCGASVSPPLPADANVDSAFLSGDADPDLADLVVGFDAPVEIPPGSGTLYSPSDLVRYRRTGSGCGDWTFVDRVFDAAAAGDGVPLTANVVGASPRGSSILLAFDVPTTLTPSEGPGPFARGEIVAWNGHAYGLFESLEDWPDTSSVAALSGSGNPGAIVTAGAEGLRLGRDPATDILTLTWSPSCSVGAVDFAVYEGVLGEFDTHAPRLCSTGGSREATLASPATDAYYLIVPLNDFAEGAYGYDSAGLERPRAAAGVCHDDQIVSACP